MEWTGYSSLLLPNMCAFSTSGGAPQDTEGRKATSYYWKSFAVSAGKLFDLWPVCYHENTDAGFELTWAFFAGKWQMVVTGHVVPLAPFMPDHHHTVFSRAKVIIWLVWPPVLILLKKKTLFYAEQWKIKSYISFHYQSGHCFLQTGPVWPPWTKQIWRIYSEF